MIAYLLAALWCAGHLCIFFIFRRRLTNEHAIFLCHVAGFLIGLSATLGALLGGWIGVAQAAGASALLGIYSLSFLEIWSLCQGGYSVSILRSLNHGPRKEEDLIGEFSSMGAMKKNERMEALTRMGLLSRNGSDCSLTAAGRIYAVALQAMRWTANHRDTG